MATSPPTILALQEENAALRQRLAELERSQRMAEQRAQLSEVVLQHIPIAVTVYHLEQPDDPYSLRLLAANPAAERGGEMNLATDMGRRLCEIFPGLPPEIFRLHTESLRSGQPRSLGEIVYRDEQRGEVIVAAQAIPLSHEHLCILFENVTDRKQMEEALRQARAQEETILAQQAALAELSTPLIPLSERVMVMPLIGAVDSMRTQQVLTTLLEGVAGSHAQIAILDITGVPVVDTQVANALIRAAQAVKLLGAQVVLTGIRPEVAQTLVGLGADLTGIVTRGNLQSGIAYATGQS